MCCNWWYDLTYIGLYGSLNPGAAYESSSIMFPIAGLLKFEYAHMNKHSELASRCFPLLTIALIPVPDKKLRRRRHALKNQPISSHVNHKETFCVYKEPLPILRPDITTRTCPRNFSLPCVS